MISARLPEEYQTQALLDYFEASVEALNDHEAHTFRSSKPPSRYLNLTDTQIQSAFRRLREELEREVVLAMLASFEAEVRLDYQDRLRRRRKDRISKGFRELAQSYGDRVRFDDILKIWRALGVAKQAFTRLGHYRKYRHWLAHGRYWRDRSGVNTDPYEVRDIFQDLADNVPGFPSPW